MLQLLGILAFLLASANASQKGFDITAENGKVVVQAGNARFRAESLTYDTMKEGGIADLEFHAEGNLIVVQMHGLQIQAAEMHYKPVSRILSCKGDPNHKARLSLWSDRHGWLMQQEAKTFGYFIGGSFGFED